MDLRRLHSLDGEGRAPILITGARPPYSWGVEETGNKALAESYENHCVCLPDPGQPLGVGEQCARVPWMPFATISLTIEKYHITLPAGFIMVAPPAIPSPLWTLFQFLDYCRAHSDVLLVGEPLVPVTDP
jgi:hypothetical protein